jgi:hypothetical protein
MEGRSLEIVNHHKILGVTIDNKLNWSEQVNNVAQKFNIKVKRLRRMKAVGCETLSEFYFKAIIPSVTYNISVWGSCSTKTLNKLEMIRRSMQNHLQSFKQNIIRRVPSTSALDHHFTFV